MKSVLLVVAALIVIAVLALRLWTAKGTRQLAAMQTAYQPDIRNDTSIKVTGWKEDELERILADFRGSYRLPDSAMVATKQGDLQFRVSFPGDVEPRILFFLVNYIRYPKGLDLQNRRIGVLGRARLSRAFGMPDASLHGLSAKIYVPANDKEFDNVYVRLESGKTFKVPFTTLIWEPVEDPRMPDEIRDAEKG